MDLQQAELREVSHKNEILLSYVFTSSDLDLKFLGFDINWPLNFTEILISIHFGPYKTYCV